MLDDTAQPTLGHASAAFLARADLATQSRRSYSQTLNRVVSELGDDSPLAALDSDQLSDAITGAWGDCAPATWNRHVATARSFAAFCQRHDWLPDAFAVRVDRRREPADRTRAARTPSSSGCGDAKTSPCARRRCGGCCTRRPPVPRRSSH